MTMIFKKNYTICCSQTINAYINIDAKNKKEALKKAKKLISKNGIPKDALIFSRELNVF